MYRQKSIKALVHNLWYKHFRSRINRYRTKQMHEWSGKNKQGFTNVSVTSIIKSYQHFCADTQTN